MLLYDNRGRIRLIFQLYGSIYRRVAIPVLGMLIYSSGLLAIRRLYSDYLPEIDHPFASQSFGTLIAFAVCFRVNIAWGRFWEACQEVTMMFSKWGDAFSQLQGFINSTIKISKDCDVQKLEHFRCEITHFFTLLSAMAVERLTRGDIRRMEMRRRKGVPWAEQVVFRENLREKDLTGSKNLIPMRVVKVRRRLCERQSSLLEEDNSESDDEVERPKRLAVVPSMSKVSLNLRQIKDTWEVPVSVIGDLSKDELRRLRASKDRIGLVLLWLNEVVTNLQPLMLVPPPILSRVYQELSNGTLGYSQAEKLSDIPFPFIFAQLLAMALMFFAVVSPITFTVITGDSWITPVISSGVVIAFWSLNEIAKELENPFGEDANNLPLVDAHERFVEFLVEMHATTLPEDRAYVVMRTTNYSVYSNRSSRMKPSMSSSGSDGMMGSSTSARTSTISKRAITSMFSENQGPSKQESKRMNEYRHSDSSSSTVLMIPTSNSGMMPDVRPGPCMMTSSIQFSELARSPMSSQRMNSFNPGSPHELTPTKKEESEAQHEHPMATVFSSSFWPEESCRSGYANVDLRIDESSPLQPEEKDEDAPGQAATGSLGSQRSSSQAAPHRSSESGSCPDTSDQTGALGVPPSSPGDDDRSSPNMLS